MNKQIAVWLTLCMIWGSTWLFVKIGLRDLPPFTFAGLRFFLSALILWALIFVRKSKLPRGKNDWVPLIWSGLLGFGINYSLLFWGMKSISSGLASVLQSMTPAFGLVLAHYFLPDEKITWRKIAGVCTGIIGVALIFSNQFSIAGTMALFGSAALFSSSLFVAASNVIIKARGAHFDPMVSAAAQMSVGVIPMFLIGFSTEGNPANFAWNGRVLFALAYLVLIGAVLALPLYYWLIGHWDVTKTMLISLITPIIAVLLGVIALNEKITLQMIVGAALILSGVGAIIGEKFIQRLLRVQAG